MRFNPPNFADLDAAQMETLFAIKSGKDIRSVSVQDTYVEDQLSCLDVVVNGVRVGAWYLGAQRSAAFFYPDTLKAKNSIAETLKTEIHTAICSMLDYGDDFKDMVSTNRPKYETVLHHIKSLRKNTIFRREYASGLKVLKDQGYSVVIDENFNIVI